MGISVVKGGAVGELQNTSYKSYISVTKVIGKESVKGFMGKLKGLLQVLCERVWMYVHITNYVDGSIIRILETSLR